MTEKPKTEEVVEEEEKPRYRPTLAEAILMMEREHDLHEGMFERLKPYHPTTGGPMGQEKLAIYRFVIWILQGVDRNQDAWREIMKKEQRANRGKPPYRR